MTSCLYLLATPRCETWCSHDWLKDAKTIDLCSNPKTKEPKLDRARRQIPEWTAYGKLSE